MADWPSYSYTPEKCLTSALDYLTKACIGLEGEEEKEELKKQVKQLVYHTEYIIAGKSPFVYKEEKEEEEEEEEKEAGTSVCVLELDMHFRTTFVDTDGRR